MTDNHARSCSFVSRAHCAKSQRGRRHRDVLAHIPYRPTPQGSALAHFGRGHVGVLYSLLRTLAQRAYREGHGRCAYLSQSPHSRPYMSTASYAHDLLLRAPRPVRHWVRPTPDSSTKGGADAFRTNGWRGARTRLQVKVSACLCAVAGSTYSTCSVLRSSVRSRSTAAQKPRLSPSFLDEREAGLAHTYV